MPEALRQERPSAQERPREVIVTDEGPILISGPIEIVMPDGQRVRSDRPVTALCVCKRSRRKPFCDTSHRCRVRTGRGADGNDTGGDNTGADRNGAGAETGDSEEEDRAQ